MKKIITICVSIVVAVGIITFIFLNVSTEVEQNVENEIEPEAEMQEEERESEIQLYFADAVSDRLVPVTKKVPAKDLIEDPYTYSLELLFEGPEEDKYKTTIPEGCKINSVDLDKGTLYIDLSNEFQNSSGTNSIYSIVNTMLQFNEVNKIKFTINGEVKEGLKDSYEAEQKQDNNQNSNEINSLES